MKIAFISDSGTGSSSSMLNKYGIYSLPLQIIDKSKVYEDMEDINYDDCIDLLKTKAVLKTSQPIVGKVMELFDYLKKENYDEIIAVPICSGLSGTIDTLKSCANMVDLNIKIFDTYVTAVVQEYLIKRIKQLIDENKPYDDIVYNVIDSANTLIIPSDLQHLKRSGRLTSVAFALAGLLKIVPILEINKKTLGKIDVFAKVRTYKKAIDTVFQQIKKDVSNSQYTVIIAHVDCFDKANEIYEALVKIIPFAKIKIIKLVNVVAVHTGLDCIAIQYFKEL